MHDLHFQNSGEAERQRRILAYCEDAGRRLSLSSAETSLMRKMIRNAADQTDNLAGSPRLLLDLGVSVRVEHEAGRRSSRQPLTSRVAKLVEAACQLDNEIAFSPYADKSLSATLSTVSSGENPSVRYILPLLRRTSGTTIATLVSKLPVFPIAVEEVIRAYRKGTATAISLAQIACRDAVLAGSLLAEAATARYAIDRPIRSIIQAIVYMGTTRACEVMLAACLRPLLATPALEGLWQHSLETAWTAERISGLTNAMSPEDAYLLGLVHDTGRLLLELASAEAREARDRLICKGSPRTVAEILTCGICHAEAGAEVLRFWKFPETFIEAVRWHHEPERSHSKEASLLYVLEFWTDAAEDLPSNARLQAALQNLGIRAKDLYDCLKREQH